MLSWVTGTLSFTNHRPGQIEEFARLPLAIYSTFAKPNKSSTVKHLAICVGPTFVPL